MFIFLDFHFSKPLILHFCALIMAIHVAELTMDNQTNANWIHTIRTRKIASVHIIVQSLYFDNWRLIIQGC